MATYHRGYLTGQAYLREYPFASTEEAEQAAHLTSTPYKKDPQKFYDGFMDAFNECDLEDVDENDGTTSYGPFNTQEAFMDGLVAGRVYTYDDVDGAALNKAGDYCAGSFTIREAFFDGFKQGALK